jgi:hypothetical protein
MSVLNELGYVASRSGNLGARPFFSEASYLPGFMSSYEIPLSFPRPNNAWTEAVTRTTYQNRKAVWKANGEWAMLLVHDQSESDSAHVDWMVDEISSDPAIWIAPFGEVATFLDAYYTDVGHPVEAAGSVTAWIHDLSATDTTWVVVTAYDDAWQESGWSNEIAIPPLDAVGAPVVPAPEGRVLAAFPNPFSERTAISFDVPVRAPGRVEFLDVRGARVRVLELGELSIGSSRVVWDGSNAHGQRLPAGVYFYRIELGERREQGKVVLVR